MPTGRIAVNEGQIQQFSLPLSSSDTVDQNTVSWLVVKARRFAGPTGGTATFTSFTRVPLAGKS
jgi:hypothetical protein